MEFSIKRVARIAELMAEEMREKLGEGVQVAEIEQGLRELAREVSGLGLQKMIEDREERYGSRVTCKCGQEAKPTGKRNAIVWSVFGKVNYARRYYLCEHCHCGQSPLDERLGLVAGQSTPGLASLLGILGVETSFEEASDLAERFLLFRVSDNTVRKHTEGYGQAQTQIEQEWKQTTAFELQEQSLKKHLGRVYASMDGAHVPLHGEWRELKTLCWYEVEMMQPSRSQNHHSERAQGVGARVGEQSHLQARNMKYYCDIQEAEQFGKLLWATGTQHQVDAFEEIIFVSDGAVWIWNLVEKYYPNAVQIVDWYHASEYLTPIAEAAFGANTAQAHEWLTQARTELWEGRIQDVIQSCRSLLSHTAARLWIEKAITYYDHNEKRMDYARFRQCGYLIGSGTIESACKQIAAVRLKRSGARWTLPGVVATAKARAAWLSKSWDSLKPIYSSLSLAT
jgi:Uncharacterised protein family (UPF0236)